MTLESVRVAWGAPPSSAARPLRYGRTFEDRTHVFKVTDRPDSIGGGARIVNFNVPGRAGGEELGGMVWVSEIGGMDCVGWAVTVE